MARRKQKPTMYTETSPLLRADPPATAPPPYSAVQSDLHEVEGDDDSIRCEVCSYRIQKSLKKNKKVVTCPRCQESTALVPPGDGKIYLRCPECNCLMVVSKSSKRSICPRDHCKTTLDIEDGRPVRRSEPSSPNSTAINQEPQYRIVCGNCHLTSVQDSPPVNNRVRCPLCRKSSYIGEGARKRQAVCYIGLGSALILLCLVLMALTMVLRHNSAYWYIYLILLGISLACHIRGLWCLCMKYSVLEVIPTIA